MDRLYFPITDPIFCQYRDRYPIQISDRCIPSAKLTDLSVSESPDLLRFSQIHSFIYNQ